MSDYEITIAILPRERLSRSERAVVLPTGCSENV
jgi:hypothetical protein